jgi:ATP-dependent Clp protease ATP-binding subunit ClpC
MAREARMFDRFAEGARRVVVLANTEARALKHQHIGTEHLLLGLIGERDGTAAAALAGVGVTLDGARRRIEEIVGTGDEEPGEHMPFTPRLKEVLELSLREALRLGHRHIDTEHILLGLVREGRGTAARVLADLGADPDRVRQQVVRLLS